MREKTWTAYVLYADPRKFGEIFCRLRKILPKVSGRFNFNFYPVPHGGHELTDMPHISLRLEKKNRTVESFLERLGDEGLIKEWKARPYAADEDTKTAYETGSRAALLIHDLLDKYGKSLRDKKFRLRLFHGIMDSSGIYRHFDEAEVYLDILKALAKRFKQDSEFVEEMARRKLGGIG